MNKKRKCSDCIYYKKKYASVFGRKGYYEEFCAEYEVSVLDYQAEVCDDYKLKETK